MSRMASGGAGVQRLAMVPSSEIGEGSGSAVRLEFITHADEL